MTWKKVDGNQSEIVDGLRRLGMTVQDLHIVGKGCPDLLVGVANVNFLVEVKADKKKPLTKDQMEWIGCWQGNYVIGWNITEITQYIVDYLELMGQSRHPDTKFLKAWLKEERKIQVENLRQKRKHYFRD